MTLSVPRPLATLFAEAGFKFQLQDKFGKLRPQANDDALRTLIQKYTRLGRWLDMLCMLSWQDSWQNYRGGHAGSSILDSHALKISIPRDEQMAVGGLSVASLAPIIDIPRSQFRWYVYVAVT